VSDTLKRQAAQAALDEVESGMRLGLGTGSTAWHFVDLLGEKVADGFECLCVPTSEQTARQAKSLNIPLTTLDDTPKLDITVDGADEIDPELSLIKGAGGALLREKIVAAASSRMIVIADDSKRVDVLGKCPLPIEINRFGARVTSNAIEALMADAGATGPATLRQTNDGTPFVTDGGHLIVDACFGRISDAKALSGALLAIPGVVQHGLFIDMCDTVYLATGQGIERITRQNR